MFWLILQHRQQKNANSNADPPIQTREQIDTLTNVIFKIIDTKLYVPVVILSTKNDNKLKQLKIGLKRTIKWDKDRSEITIQTKNNNLSYLID